MASEAITRDKFKSFFRERVRGFMFHDIRAAIEGHANFLAALGLFSYTEVLGGLITGEWGSSKAAKDNFMTFLREMGGKYQELASCDVDVYQLFRNELAHRYFMRSEGVVAMKGPLGLHVASEPDGSQVIEIAVEKYFEDFKRAAEDYYDKVICGQAKVPVIP